jgi:hypothetical protein
MAGFFFSEGRVFSNLKHVLLGNLPILVTKTGEIVRIPHQIGLEKAISRYEAGLPFFAKEKAEISTNP